MRQARYSSQRQLRLGLELLVGWLVGPSVRLSLFLDNRSKDFHETWQLFRDRYYEETDESFFGKKSGSFNNSKKCVIFEGFSNFSRNLVLKLVLFIDENGSTNQI